MMIVGVYTYRNATCAQVHGNQLRVHALRSIPTSLATVKAVAAAAAGVAPAAATAQDHHAFGDTGRTHNIFSLLII